MSDLVPTDIGIPTGVSLRDPNSILAEAKERASALTNMVEQTKSFTQIGPSKHLRVEAWITIGQFYGCSARVTDTEHIELGGVQGFKAHAKVTHDASGQVLTEADSLCMQDEDNWSNKPLFQLMSMAQTRALSKALAAKFRWVVVLGGYAATPAEEMTGCEREASQKSAGKHSKPTLKLAFGRSKGKAINDPSVPTEDLEWMGKYLTDGLQKPERAKWRAQDEEMIAVLRAELGRRANASPEPNAAEEKPISDEEWARLTKDWAIYRKLDYAALKAELGIEHASRIDPAQRRAFQQRMG